MCVELTITIKDPEGKKLSRPFLIYEPFSMEATDPTIQRFVKEMIAEFKGDPDDVRVRATMVL